VFEGTNSPVIQADTHQAPFKTDVPARLDALPWSTCHTMIIIALGVTWVLDGLEVTLSGAVGNALRNRQALGLSETQIGLSGTAYLAGAVVGALVFGWATDCFGVRNYSSLLWHCMSVQRRQRHFRGTRGATLSSAH
jgi:MFS family permease